MKYKTWATIILAVVILAACATPPATKIPSETAAVSPVVIASETAVPVQTSAGDTQEEVEIRDLIQRFGKQLQKVSLLAPDAAQQIKDQYAEFVSPTVLGIWMNDVSRAPGRMVSSPWPDRIEIATITKEGTGKYAISGDVIEVTSVEMTSGGAAAKIPVRLIVQKEQGHWLITGFVEAN